MNNLSNERLQKIASWRDKYGNSHNVVIPSEEAEAMARELLAYREAAGKPVAWECKVMLCHTLEQAQLYTGKPEPLYAAPQLPTLPNVLPCPVKLEPGLVLGKGVKTQTLLDALIRREKYYAELEAMTPEQRAEHEEGIASIKSMLATANHAEANSPEIPNCWCHACNPQGFGHARFVVCPGCGNKRCPKANNHVNACTGSNEPGQEGSAYPAAPKPNIDPDST